VAIDVRRNVMQRNGMDARRGVVVVVVGAFGQPRRPLPTLVGRGSATIVSLAAYRAARSIRKGHAWLELGQAGSDCD
jgi:hypothetical protein